MLGYFSSDFKISLDSLTQLCICNMEDLDVNVGERAMEVEALVSIYEDDLKITDEDDKNSMCFEIELKEIGALLTLTLLDEYPRIGPRISVQKSGNHFDELEEFLKKISDSLCGEVMIHSLIEEARNWARGRMSKNMGSKKEAPASVCKFYLEGKCKFGDRCLNIHPVAEKEIEETQNLKYKDDYKEKVASEIQSHKNTRQSANSIHNNERRASKKPPMKTATDMISRILWDDKLDPKDFTIGYLDRFIGIIERDFSDFSWEDIASVDYDVLSIPKHRIQFFKYRGGIVWDKRTRIDKVFGSTGSGCTILDIMENDNKENRKEESEDMDEKENAQEEEEEEVTGYSGITTSPRDINRPNYFIALKVKDQGILENIKKLQRELSLKEKDMSDGIISPQNLHVTLLVLTLRSSAEVDLVKDILKGIHHVLPSTLSPSTQLNFKGIGSFSDRVLYVSVEEEPNFKTFLEIMRRQLDKAGIDLNGNRESFTSHVSIARAPLTSKMSRAKSREVFSTFEAMYKNFVFGNQGVTDIGFFSRFDPKDPNGFHRTILTMENSLLSVLPTLDKKVTKYVQDLYNSEKISIELKKKVDASFDAKTPEGLDEALTMLEAAVPKDTSKLVLILRGIPGAGKSYLVENSFENIENRGLTICNPKQLFYRAGNSKMDQSELNIAGAYCRNSFLEALSHGGSSVIAVDDCHAKLWEYAFHEKLASIFGFPAQVLEINARDHDAILECLQHGESGSSMDELIGMASEWEEDTKALLIEPWFRNPTLREKEAISLRNLVKPMQ